MNRILLVLILGSQLTILFLMKRIYLDLNATIQAEIKVVDIENSIVTDWRRWLEVHR